MGANAKSHYHHGRRQMAADVEAVASDEAARRDKVLSRIAAARQAERDRPRLGRADVDGATQVLPAGSRQWLPVVRVNASSVTVIDWQGQARIPFARVAEVRRP